MFCNVLIFSVHCGETGIIAGYEFSPIVAVDIAFTNGEGRKFKNMDNNYKYGAGVTLRPVDGLMFKLYGYIYNLPDYISENGIIQKSQYSIATFAGYSNRHFSIGTEYNKFLSATDINGYSAYTTVNHRHKNMYMAGLIF